jgi:mannose-6-phosphate isomerase-like protein (cupin superfamily)
MPTINTNRRRPRAIQPPPEPGPRIPERTAGRGSVRVLDMALFPEDRFCSQNLYQGEETTIMVSRDPAHARGPRAHYHPDEDQFFLTLRGELQIDLGAEAHTMRPGSFAHIPAGTFHRHHNEGDVDELHLEILTPGFSVTKPPALGWVDEDIEWEGGGTVVHPPDESAWRQPAPGVRVFAFSEASGSRDPAVRDSKKATILLSRSEPGTGNASTHLHRFDQFYYVIEGTLGVDIGFDSYEVGPDSLVVIPAGVPHSNRVVGDARESHVMLNVPPPTSASTADDPWDIRVSLERSSAGAAALRS